MLSGFKQFILRGNVVDMAVGVVIGAAFASVVTAFTKDLLTPLIAAIVKAPNFAGLKFTINGSEFRYGSFINAVISFVSVATVVFFAIVKPVSVLNARRPAEGEPAVRECPECLSAIPAAARRCPHCTSEVTPAA